MKRAHPKTTAFNRVSTDGTRWRGHPTSHIQTFPLGKTQNFPPSIPGPVEDGIGNDLRMIESPVWNIYRIPTKMTDIERDDFQ